MYEWHGYGGGMMWVFWVLLLLALAAFVVVLTRGPQNTKNREKTAIEILQDRYARGEIDRDEYLQMRDDLKQ